MKLKFLLIVMAVAAMGPNRSEAPPRIETPPRAPDEVTPPAGAAVSAPTPAPADALTVLAADAAAPEDFRWQSRPLVIFADTAQDPAFIRQLQMLGDRPHMLEARDVVVVADTDPGAVSAWRQKLRPEGFSLVLIDKDGQVKLRKPFPWDVREITRAIDKLPLRRQEVGRGNVLGQ